MTKKRIFINYRRSLNLASARLLRAELQKHFGRSQVFLDVRNLDGGDHWLHKLENEIDQSAVVLCLIGKGWLDQSDKKGNRQIDNPHDFVRFEISRALNRGIPVLPVQIDGALMPQASELPPNIQALTYTHGTMLRGESFEDDATKIADRIKQLIAANQKPPVITVFHAALISIISCLSTVAVAYGLSLAGFIQIGQTDAKLKKRISTLESKIAKQAEQIARLHSKALTVDDLAGKLGALQERKTELEKTIEGQLSKLEEKNLKISELGGRIAKMSSRFDIGGAFRDCKECPEMVVLPAGSFTMGSENGSSDEQPQREVTIAKRFAVSKFEVTFEEWDACVAAGTCQHNPGDSKWGRKNRPVINVAWEDAKAYISWLNTKVDGSAYRLLSEAEWEYAARAGAINSSYSWGNEIGNDKANCKGCGSRWDNKQTAPAGSFDANAFGLYDLLGNVWEWTEDCWNDDYKRAPVDGTAWTDLGDCRLRVVRGGAWSFGPENLRLTKRRRYISTNRLSSIGFRVARSLESPITLNSTSEK